MATNNSGNILVGTSGQVFEYSSTGPVVADAIDVGAMIKLSSQTASNSASIEFTSVITSAYQSYKLIMYGVIPATDGSDLTLQFSVDNGSTWETTAGDYMYYNHANQVTTDTSYGSSSNTSYIIADNNDNTTIMAFVVDFLATTTTNPMMFSHGTARDTGTSNYGVHNGCGRYTQGAVINAVRVICSSGNITSGTFKLYGMN